MRLVPVELTRQLLAAPFRRIEVTEEPRRVFSLSVKGYSVLKVRIPPDQVRMH